MLPVTYRLLLSHEKKEILLKCDSSPFPFILVVDVSVQNPYMSEYHAWYPMKSHPDKHSDILWTGNWEVKLKKGEKCLWIHPEFEPRIFWILVGHFYQLIYWILMAVECRSRWYPRNLSNLAASLLNLSDGGTQLWHAASSLSSLSS